MTQLVQMEQYVAPASLEQALAGLQQAGGDVTILAGGTDLMPQQQAGRLKPKQTLMNIRRIAELKGVTLADGIIHIGPLTTITELMDNALLRRYLPLLAEAGDHFASNQIRNVGTLGGNICNASPAGDMLVPLLVLEASAELASFDDGKICRRSVPLIEFFVGPGKTSRAPTELLTGICIALPPDNFTARFFKFGSRPALDISAISIGIGGVLRDGTLCGVRVAFGAVAATPVRGRQTEAALEGKRLDAATIEAAASAARDEVNPIDDLRASAWYRKQLIHNMTKRILSHVAQD
ncbi:MAG: xanthine dehydrogenase family protein subunit M [Glaciimonas sp.]|nr:xanthine dehydrogenase family protein subunit M [Glaciimonas sp.]